MTFSKRAWFIFAVVLIGLIALWFLAIAPTQVEVTSQFGEITRK